MSLDKSVIDLAIQKRYSDFSNAMRIELRSKLSRHPEIVRYSNEFDKIQKMKIAFSQIVNPHKESKWAIN